MIKHLTKKCKCGIPSHIPTFFIVAQNTNLSTYQSSELISGLIKVVKSWNEKGLETYIILSVDTILDRVCKVFGINRQIHL